MSKQTTLMQSWASAASKPSNLSTFQPTHEGVIDLLDEEDDELLRAMEESLKYHQPHVVYGGGQRDISDGAGTSGVNDVAGTSRQGASSSRQTCVDYSSAGPNGINAGACIAKSGDQSCISRQGNVNAASGRFKNKGGPVKASRSMGSKSQGLFRTVGANKSSTMDNSNYPPAAVIEEEEPNFDIDFDDDLEEMDVQEPRPSIPTATSIEDLPGFDKQAGQIWIYPTNYPMRDYQYNIVQQALYKNTLVVLPTGLGKTFIAAVVMYNFYRW